MKKISLVSALILNSLFFTGCENLSPYEWPETDTETDSRVCSEHKLRQILSPEEYQRLEKKYSWRDQNGVKHPGFYMDYDTGLIYKNRPVGAKDYSDEPEFSY